MVILPSTSLLRVVGRYVNVAGTARPSRYGCMFEIWYFVRPKSSPRLSAYFTPTYFHILYIPSYSLHSFTFFTFLHILYIPSYSLHSFVFFTFLHILYILSYSLHSFVFFTFLHILYIPSYSLHSFIFFTFLHILYTLSYSLGFVFFYQCILLSFEEGNSGSHYVESWLWKRLWTCRKTGY